MHAPMHILTPIPLRTLCFEAYNGALHQCRNSFKSTYGCIFVHTALQIGAFAATHSFHMDTHVHAFIPTQTESWSHWGECANMVNGKRNIRCPCARVSASWLLGLKLYRALCSAFVECFHPICTGGTVDSWNSGLAVLIHFNTKPHTQ